MNANEWFHSTINSMKNKYINYRVLTSSFWWSFLKISDEFSLLSNAFTTRVKLWILAWKKRVGTMVYSQVFWSRKLCSNEKGERKIALWDVEKCASQWNYSCMSPSAHTSHTLLFARQQYWFKRVKSFQIQT